MKSDESRLLNRRDWIDACGFLPFEREALIEDVRRHDRSAAPVVLIDLDSTLYQVAHRTRAILTEAATEFADALEPEIAQRLQAVAPQTIGYSLEETLAWMFDRKDSEAGYSRHFDRLHDFWWERFFSDQFLELDQPYLEALELVTDLHRAGAHVTYLTGREHGRMQKGTLQCLQRDGFPVGTARTELILKPEKSMDDAVYKADVARRLAQRAPVLASFENEPRNFAAIHATLPAAKHVFVDTVCSLKPAPVCRGGYVWIPTMPLSDGLLAEKSQEPA